MYGDDEGAALWENAKPAQKPAERPAVAKQPALGKQPGAAVPARRQGGGGGGGSGGGGGGGGGGSAGKQPVGRQPNVESVQGAAHKRPAVVYELGETVTARWWAQKPGEKACAWDPNPKLHPHPHLSPFTLTLTPSPLNLPPNQACAWVQWWNAVVTRVDEAEATVSLLYDDGQAEAGVPLKYVRRRAAPPLDLGASGEGEVSIMEATRARNIESNRQKLVALGLGPEPARRRSPLSKAGKGPPSLALAPSRAQPSRDGRTDGAARASAPTELRLGFDFGIATALLAHQAHVLHDVLLECYGEHEAHGILRHGQG